MLGERTVFRARSAWPVVSRPREGSSGRVVRGGLCPHFCSGGNQRGHPPEVQCCADEFPLGAYTLKAAQAELAEPQHALDPAVGRLGDPLALAIGGASRGGLHLRGHGRGVRQPRGIDGRVLLAFAPQGHNQIDRRIAQVVLAAIARVGQTQRGQRAQVLLDRIDHRQQPVGIGCRVVQFRSHDDVRSLVHRRLRVVAGVEAAAGALHDAAVRVGEVLLRLVFGHAEVALEPRTAPRLPIRPPGTAIIIVTATTLRVGFTLTLFQPLARLPDRIESRLAPLDLGRDVEFGLLRLGLVGGLGARQQRVDLLFQFDLGVLHARIAHGLVAARVGLDLGAVDGHRAQLDQTHLARQAHDLHEQVREFLEVQRTEIPDRAVLGEVPCCQHPERQVLVQPALDLARAEHPGGVAVHQNLDHHRRMEGLVARSATLIARVERAQVQRVNRVVDEVSQVARRQPVLRRRRQQHHLVRLIGAVTSGHAVLTHAHRPTSTSTTFCRPHS